MIYYYLLFTFLVCSCSSVNSTQPNCISGIYINSIIQDITKKSKGDDITDEIGSLLASGVLLPISLVGDWSEKLSTTTISKNPPMGYKWSVFLFEEAIEGNVLSVAVACSKNQNRRWIYGGEIISHNKPRKM